MQSPRTKLALRVLLVLALMAGLVTVVTAQGDPAKEKLKALTEQLKQVTAQELATGQTAETPKGRFFTGESATKVENLHRQAAKAYEATIARPEVARGAAVANIRSFTRSPNLGVEYKSTSKSSYNSNVIAEFYMVGKDYYEIDTRTNQIVQFGPAPLPRGEQPKQYDTTPRYSPQQLEVMARTLIAERAGVDVSGLTPNHGNKGDVNFFFRWEDRTKHLEDGMYPFIQAGFTRGGDFLSYTNSLGMGR